MKENYGIHKEANKRKMQIARSFKDDQIVNLQISLVKGKPAQEGETRTHGGVKVKKQGGKWIPVSGDKKGKKDPTQNKRSKKQDQKQPTGQKQSTIHPKDRAQLLQIKKLITQNKWSDANELAQQLDPEVSKHIPQDVWNNMSSGRDETAFLDIQKKIQKQPTGQNLYKEDVKGTKKSIFKSVGDRPEFGEDSKAYKKARKNPSKETVQIKDLLATENHQDEDKLLNIVKNFDEKEVKNNLPTVVKYKEKYYIYDGHHRLSAKKYLGHKDAQVSLVDVDKEISK